MHPTELDPAAPGHFEQFGIVREVLDQVMRAALSLGATDCDLFFEHKVSTAVALSDSKVNRASTDVDLGLGVRARVGDQIGYAYTEDLSLQAMLRAARTAAAIARSTPGVAPVALSPLDLPSRYQVETSWMDVGMDKRVPMVRAWEERAFSLDSRIEKVQTSLADTEKWILLARPDGRLAEDYQPMTRAHVVCTAIDGDVRESNSYNLAARAGLEFYSDAARIERMVQKAVERTVFLLDAGKPTAGDMPVVLAAGASGILLHEAIGHGLEADFNRKGVSIYAARMDKKVAPEFVTVVDDGTVPGARGAINVDDEGNVPERTVLIENGVLRSYMHDEISAAHYGVQPTGSGRRESFRHHPLPRMRATYMDPGPHDPAEIIANTKRGIYATSFSNGAVQIGAGDFTFYMKTGFLIEDGKLTRPIKDVNIIGNGPAALEQVDMVGDDLTIDEGGWTCGKDGQGVPVSQGQPTVRVKSLVVGGE